MNENLTTTRERLRHDVIQQLRDTRQLVDLVPLRIKGVDQSPVVIPHLRQLGSHLAWQFYSVLDRRVWLKRFPFDLLEQIGTTTEELVVRELPSLYVRRRALRSWCLLSKGFSNTNRGAAQPPSG